MSSSTFTFSCWWKLSRFQLSMPSSPSKFQYETRQPCSIERYLPWASSAYQVAITQHSPVLVLWVHRIQSVAKIKPIGRVDAQSTKSEGLYWHSKIFTGPEAERSKTTGMQATNPTSRDKSRSWEPNPKWILFRILMANWWAHLFTTGELLRFGLQQSAGGLRRVQFMLYWGAELNEFSGVIQIHEDIF